MGGNAVGASCCWSAIMRIMLATVAWGLLLCAGAPALASIPLRTPVQGVLRDNAGVPVAEDAFSVVFSLYTTPEEGEAIWSESWPPDGGDCTADPTGCVQVQGGIFRVELGSHTPLSTEVFSLGTLWLGVSVEGEPELPRRALGTSPYAFHSGVAGDLDCTGCVGEDDLAPGLRQGIVDQAVAAVADVGYAKADEVFITEEDLPGSGLNEVSNGILSNEFSHVFSALEPLPIEDDYPPGVTSEIVVPDVGVVRSLRVSIDLSNSDISSLTVSLIDAAGETLVLWAGGEDGDQLVATYPAPQVPVDGDLTAWEGQNPAGSWFLQVVDDGFLDDNLDGQINSWSVELEILSADELHVAADVGIQGDMDVSGDLSVGGAISGPGGITVNGRIQIGEDEALCDASRAGSVQYDPETQRLLFCDGTSLLQLKACDTACNAPGETLCGVPITNGCGEPCEGVGTAVDATQCLILASSTPCQEPVTDTCGNDCGSLGTGDNPATCPDPLDVPCGNVVQDPCGNLCGGLGGQCADGLLCKGASCVAPANCAEVLELNPGAPDGSYFIDPDGPGGAPDYEVTCDMTTDGGGWMLVDIDYLRLQASLTTETSCGAGEEHGFVDGNTIFYGYPNCHDVEVFNDFNVGVNFTEIRGAIAFFPSSGSVGSWTTSGAHPDNDAYNGYASDAVYTLDAGGTGGNRSWHRWGKPGQVVHVYSTLGWTGEWQSQKTLSFAAISVVDGPVVRFSTFSESGAASHERWAFAPTLYVR